MAADVIGQLCVKCGLCCDGSLFADVELSGPKEAAGLEAMGLAVEDDDGDLLTQPCAALEGTRCGIYAFRPGCCCTFECRLLQEVSSGALAVERARARIAETVKSVRQVRQLAASLAPSAKRWPLQELCAEALAGEAAALAAAGRKRTRLKAEMVAMKRRLGRWFLGEL